MADGEGRIDVRFGLLGPLEVTVSGRLVNLGGLRPRGVLAMLLVAGGRSVSEDAFIDALWGEDPPRGVRNSLQSHVSRLRQRLGQFGGAELAARIHGGPGGYRLSVAPEEVDVTRVEALLRRARAALADDDSRVDTATALLDEALSCWRGPPLADLVDLPGWHTSGLAASRARLDELESTVQEERLGARLAAGSHAMALPELEQAAAAQPLREHPHRMLAIALYRSGRVTDALAALRRHRDRLVDEAGLDPSAELVELERAILSGDPDLDLPPDRIWTEGEQPNAAPRHRIPARVRTPVGTFVGRQRELDWLLQRMAQADAGRGGVVLIAGEPGIGKTRLLSALTDSESERGSLVLSGRCLDGAGTIPYYPFAEAVKELLASGSAVSSADAGAIAALVPDWLQPVDNAPPPPRLQPDELRMRLFDGVSQFLLSLTRLYTVVVVVDDLQWADPSTIAMLRHVARSAQGQKLVLVGAYRDGEVAVSLSDALAGMRSETDCEAMRLAGLDEIAVDRLLVEEAAAPLATSLVGAIATQTGGNPLFAREMIRHLLEEGTLQPSADGSLHTEQPMQAVPDGVRQVIARRRRRLSPVANQLLDAAAAVDGPFPFEPIADVAGLAASTALDGLDETLEAGLVSAGPDPDRYNFAHALIRNTIYTTLNPSRRLRLHRRLAITLEAARNAGMAITPAEIAVQFHRSAGLPGADQGVESALQAAAMARAAGAHDEDATFLVLARDMMAPDDPRESELLIRSAVALAWSLRFDEALAAGRHAARAVASDSGPAAAATTAADLAATLTAAGSNRHAWELASHGVDLAEAAAGQVAPASRAALVLLDLERREAADPTNPGIPLDVPERREALLILHEEGLLAGRADLGRYAAAAIYGTRERVPAEVGADPTVAMLLLGDFADALPRLEAAAATAHDLGQLAWELYCRSGAARCHAALGDLAAAAAVMQVADDLAARIAGERTGWQLTTHLGAQDALAMALDSGWQHVLAAASPLLGSGQPEHQWALATLAAAHARGHARLGNASIASQLLPRSVGALRKAPTWAPNYLRTACDVAETLWLLDISKHITDVEAALQRAVQTDFRFPMMDARLALARLYALDRRADQAVHWFSASREALDAQSARPLRAIVDHDEARMHIRRGDHDSAAPLVAAAADQFRELGMHGWTRRLSKLA